MGFFLKEKIDFKRHNEEVKRLWEDYREKKHTRVPVIIGGSIRNFFENPYLNREGYTFYQFYNNPDIHIKCQLLFQKWWRENIICDREMGPPDEGWQINIDFQNNYEAGWFGCNLVYLDDFIPPDTEPIFKENKYKLYEIEPPDPLYGNLLGRAMEFFEYINEKCKNLEFEGKPVKGPTTIPGEGTDGPFTVAGKLRGLTEIFFDMFDDEKYFFDLMNFVTENIIRRMKEIRKWRWKREGKEEINFKTKYFCFADDLIANLSVEKYKYFVFPFHKRIVEEFSDGGPIHIHLCGDASHLFKFLKENLNVYSFDTGFPIDFGKVRKELGEEVEIIGGPNIVLLKNGKKGEIEKEVKKICESGIMKGKRFIMREANNLAPLTPVENIKTMYESAKIYGRYFN